MAAAPAPAPAPAASMGGRPRAARTHVFGPAASDAAASPRLECAAGHQGARRRRERLSSSSGAPRRAQGGCAQGGTWRLERLELMSTVPPDTDIQLRVTTVMLRAVNGQSARTRRPRSKGPRWTRTQPKPHFEAALVCVAMTHIGARREGKHRAAAPYQVRSTATRFAPRRRIMRRIRIDTFTR